MAVLGGSNSGWLNDDIVNDSGDHHEVSKEDECVDGHGGREGERRQLQAETRRLKEAEWEDLENVEDWIHGGSNCWSRLLGFLIWEPLSLCVRK